MEPLNTIYGNKTPLDFIKLAETITKYKLIKSDDCFFIWKSMALKKKF